MSYTNSVDTASVSSNLPHHIQTNTYKETYDTDSILSLTSQLCFRIDEQSKAQFFQGLEAILEEESQKPDSEQDYSGLIDFFMGHVSSDGSISA